MLDRFRDWRNRTLADPVFQDWAASFPLTQPIARRRAREIFDLTAGFVYSQVLFACVELGVLEALEGGALTAAALADKTGLPEEGATRLARAAAALGLLERRGQGFALGPHGAALLGNRGVFAMILHHRALYSDLRDPSAFFRSRSRDTELARFWNYSGGESRPYSTLMEATNALISAEALHAYSFARHRHVLDLGGGSGAFLRKLKARHPHLKATLCDLPGVAEIARRRFAEEGVDADVVACDFRREALPEGPDIVTLIRVLHDHDDDVARLLLAKIRKSLPQGATLLIAEPMADTPGARPMGDAYFGVYLWAMGAGRPRSSAEISQLLREAGFAHAKCLRSRRPILTSIVVAH